MTTVALDTVTTVSDLPKKMLHTPFSGTALPLVVAAMGALTDVQQTAASAVTKHVARHAGKLRKLLIGTANLAAASETMSFDVAVNGTTIFIGDLPLLENVTSPVGLYDVTGLTLAAGVFIGVGDVITITRVLASGSTLTATEVTLEWG